MRFVLAATLVLLPATGGCCISEASVQAIEARTDADNDASARQAMAKAWALSHATDATPPLVAYGWHAPRVPDTAMSWNEVPRDALTANEELVLKGEHTADLRTTWGAWSSALIDARTAGGAPVLLVRAEAGERFGRGADGRTIRFVPVPRWTERRLHSCGTCGGGMPNPYQRMDRAAAFYVFEGQTASGMRTIEVPYDATQITVRCDHLLPS